MIISICSHLQLTGGRLVFRCHLNIHTAKTSTKVFNNAVEYALP